MNMDNMGENYWHKNVESITVGGLHCLRASLLIFISISVYKQPEQFHTGIEALE